MLMMPSGHCCLLSHGMDNENDQIYANNKNYDVKNYPNTYTTRSKPCYSVHGCSMKQPENISSTSSKIDEQIEHRS